MPKLFNQISGKIRQIVTLNMFLMAIKVWIFSLEDMDHLFMIIK